MKKAKQCCKAVWYILRLNIYVLLLPLFAIWPRHLNGKVSQQFYFAMCSNVMFRLLYCLAFASGIAAVNTIYIWLSHDYSGAALTLAVSLPLLFERTGQPILAALRESRQILFFLMVIALTALFTPHLYTFAASLYLLKVAAVFYPSCRAMEKFQTYDGIRYYQQCPDTLMAAYFD